MNKPLITVVIPIYNVEKYLKKCIESIIKQTYKNIEIILVNDGSTDNCPKICDEYAKKDKRIIVIHKKNGGVSEARNAGIDIAKGKYITFIDSDDYVAKEYIENLYVECEKNNTEVSLIGTRYLNKKGKVIFSSKVIQKTYTSEEAIKQLFLGKYYDSGVCGKMYKTTLLNNIRFNKDIKIGEDLDVFYKILLKCKNIRINTKLKMYNYIARIDSVTNSVNIEIIEEDIKIAQNMIEDVSTRYPKLKKYAIRRYITINVINIIKLIKSNKIKEEEKDIKIQKLKENINMYKRYKYFQPYKIKIKIFLIYNNPNILKKILKEKEKLQ